MNIKKLDIFDHKQCNYHHSYYRKHFSIMGDSISTLNGYNPTGYNVFYADETCNKTGVCKMEDTWWGQVIEYFGGKLLINNSWSGSRVSKIPGRKELFPSGCSVERTSGLHLNDILPDVIIVYMGTNDWGYGSNVSQDEHNKFSLINLVSDSRRKKVNNKNYEHFEVAYDDMLKKIKNNYPDSEIWCCTLSETYMISRPDFVFPHTYAGIHIEVYNKVIRKMVKKYRCRLLDLYAYHMPYDSIDGSHPTYKGMKTLASLMIKSIVDEI